MDCSTLNYSHADYILCSSAYVIRNHKCFYHIGNTYIDSYIPLDTLDQRDLPVQISHKHVVRDISRYIPDHIIFDAKTVFI